MSNQSRPSGPPIEPPNPAGAVGSQAAAEEPKVEKPPASGKSLHFNPQVLLKGSHYIITKSQLVEGGVPSNDVFTVNGVTEVVIGPDTGYKVPVEVFSEKALERLLREPDLELVDENKTDKE
jgi:hypothetical protein